MKIGVYVGSFNPVHKGHIGLIKYLLQEGYVSRMEVVATGNYWDKTDLLDTDVRIEMLKFYESSLIKIMDELNELPYTYMIMDRLLEKYPNDELYLIIGADNLVNFSKWKRVDKLLKMNILVIPRNGIDIWEYLRENNYTDSFLIVDGFREMDISSSYIRELIRKGDILELKKYLDDDVLNYILLNRLYVDK